MNAPEGAFASQHYMQLIAQKRITSRLKINDAQIQPSSIDLRVHGKGYRIPAWFVPGRHRVRDAMQHLTNNSGYYALDINKGAFLESRKTYLLEIAESLRLPSTVSGLANPKSSIGRIDTFVRVITDYGDAFDSVKPGYNGPLYLLVQSHSFNLLVKSGVSFTQLRLFNQRKILTTGELELLYDHEPFLYNANGDPLTRDKVIIKDDGVYVTVNLACSPCGYCAKRHTLPVDLTKKNHYPVSEYWEPIEAPHNQLTLDPEEFYIFHSKERIQIPSDYACVMAEFDSGIGEFRSHYAGFFDPGFGKDGGAHAVFEVRVRDVPMLIHDGQILAKFSFERMNQTPSRLYGDKSGSHYQGQGLKLAKYFRN